LLRPAVIASPKRAHALLVSALVLSTTSARAASDRLVLGTHDAALASALSVAVSPRGLSVVELPEPLSRAADVEAARREVALPGTVAVVWLCDDASRHALCFCGADGRFVARPVSVSSPLAPSDAAALALSVKMMLGPPSPPAATPRAAPPPQSQPPPAETIARAAPAATTASRPPALAVELDLGARRQGPDAHVGLRGGARAVFAPDLFGRALGAGLGLSSGPALATPVGPSVSDSAIDIFVRGRVPVGRAWLELDAGPSLHFLSAEGGSRRTDLALDALAGAVVPLGRYLVGARAGGFYDLTAPSGVLVSAGATTPIVLPRWNGEAMLTLGFAFR
jgi:hypothetical protein